MKSEKSKQFSDPIEGLTSRASAAMRLDLVNAFHGIKADVSKRVPWFAKRSNHATQPF